MTAETFRCGHPRTPENSVFVKPQCAFCYRVRKACVRAETAQARINAGGYSIGQRIASGQLHG